MSPSYNELTFASEYMGVWAGGSEESWFNFEKISKYRKIKNPEWKQKFTKSNRFEWNFEEKKKFYTICNKMNFF